MLTVEQREAHKRYEGASNTFQDVADRAVKAAMDVIRESGMDAAGDDRAEALLAGIVVYMEDSAEP